MAIRALADNKFNRRNIFIAVVGLAIGLWGAYDAVIGFPYKLKKAEEYAKLGDLDSEARSEKWQEITKAKGWKRDIPKKA